jgi:hypothetical protein
MKRTSLVSQSVIDAGDALRAETMAKVNADPKLRKIYDDAIKEAQDNIDRHKKLRLKRKVDGTVVEVEVVPRVKPKTKRVKKPLTPAAKQRKSDKAEDHRLIVENDQILRALAIMRDGRCVIPDCPHPLDSLQMSHIYAKELKMYPWMRWLLPNVEMRCVWHHKWAPGSPHSDPAGFHAWLSKLPVERTEYLALEAVNKRDGKSLEFKRDTNRELRGQYLKVAGLPWGK